MRAVAYLRVSTAGQGRSGLGIEAQRSAVESLVRQRHWTLSAEFLEVESGKKSDRPELAKALREAKITGGVLVIAKLDRLSRNAAFLLALRDSGVRFLAADIPDANDLTIGVLAVIAQAERDAISRRTVDALASIRQRLADVGSHTSVRSSRQIHRLGNPNGAAALRRATGSHIKASLATVRAADQTALDIAPILNALRAEGCTSLARTAAELNRRSILTPRRQAWHPASVRNVLRRLERLGGG